MYTIYTIPGACSSGLVVLLEKLGVEYTAVKREDVSDYRSIVPTNQVPALKTETGQIITEGGAIALYLLERHNSEMLPKELPQKAEFLRWFMFDFATLHPAYGKLFAVSKRLQLSEAEKEKALQNLAEGVSDMWAVVDQQLKKTTFVTGDKPTIVDYMMTVYSSWGNAFPGVKIILGKNVERVIDAVAALPEFQAAYAREGATYKRYPQ